MSAMTAAGKYNSDLANESATEPRCPASPPGSRQRNGSEAGEQELLFVGPTIALRAQHWTDMSNEKSPGTNTLELIFAPAAAAIVFIKGTGDNARDPFANAGYDPDEPRVSAGQTGRVNGRPGTRERRIARRKE